MAQQKNQEQALLKTSFFGGFNKSEVLGYIDRLREQNRQMELELAGQLEGVTRARGELAEQMTGFEGKITEMETQLDTSAGRIRELTGMVEMLRGAVTEQKRREEELRRHGEEQRGQMEEQLRRREEEQERELKGQKEQARQLMLRAQNFEVKAKRYEEISNQVGDILIEAGQDAERMLEQAEQEAQQIKSTAMAVSSKITHEMHSMRADLSTARTQIVEVLHGINARLGELDRLIEEATPDFDTDRAVELLSAKRQPEVVVVQTAPSPAAILDLWNEPETVEGVSLPKIVLAEEDLFEQSIVLDEVEVFDEDFPADEVPEVDYLEDEEDFVEPQAARPVKAMRHNLPPIPSRNQPSRAATPRVGVEKKRSGAAEPKHRFFGGAAKS